MTDLHRTRATRRTLAMLVRLRWLAVLGQALTIGILHFGFDLRLPLLPMAAVLLGQCLLNLCWRWPCSWVCRAEQPTHLSHCFFFI